MIHIPYFYDKNEYLVSVKQILDDPNNTKTIVSACQKYLDEYANGKKHPFTPDIDSIIEKMELNK